MSIDFYQRVYVDTWDGQIHRPVLMHFLESLLDSSLNCGVGRGDMKAAIERFIGEQFEFSYHRLLIEDCSSRNGYFRLPEPRAHLWGCNTEGIVVHRGVNFVTRVNCLYRISDLQGRVLTAKALCDAFYANSIRRRKYRTFIQMMQANRLNCSAFMASKKGSRMYCWLRQPGTFQEIRNNQCNAEPGAPMVRGRRRKNSLPTSWDDIYRKDCKDRSWKRQSKRKKQFRLKRK